MSAHVCVANACENADECGHLADVDVYFEEENPPGGHQLCTCCASKVWSKPNCIQVVPAHGGDETCIPIPKQ